MLGLTANEFAVFPNGTKNNCGRIFGLTLRDTAFGQNPSLYVSASQ